MLGRLVVALVAVLALYGCSNSSSRVYVGSSDTQSYILGRKSGFVYPYLSSDSLGLYNIGVYIRHDNQYVNESFDFSFAVEDPMGRVWRDTLSLPIYGSNGKYRGYRNVRLYNLEQIVVNSANFKELGDYKFYIKPIDNNIDGIVNVGVFLEQETKTDGQE